MFGFIMLFGGGISTGILLCLAVRALFHVVHHCWGDPVPGGNPAMSSDSMLSVGQMRPTVRWLRSLLLRGSLVGALLLASGLYASFALAQPTLQHVDPVVFTALQLMVGLLVALVLLGWTCRPETYVSVRLGWLGGLPLGLGFVGIALSLRTLGIVPTTMLTALDGLMASLISWLILRQPPSFFTVVAALCASGGAFLFWWIAPSQWQMDIIAISCGLLFTVYAFHVERHRIAQGSWRRQLLPFFGGLFSSMALTALLLAVCFGQWASVQSITTTDLALLLYCGLATSLLPQVVWTLLLRQMSAVSLAFCAMLEPLLSLGFASWHGSLVLGIWGWSGVGLILCSLLLQSSASRLGRAPTLSAAGGQGVAEHVSSSEAEQEGGTNEPDAF